MQKCVNRSVELSWRFICMHISAEVLHSTVYKTYIWSTPTDSDRFRAVCPSHENSRTKKFQKGFSCFERERDLYQMYDSSFVQDAMGKQLSIFFSRFYYQNYIFSWTFFVCALCILSPCFILVNLISFEATLCFVLLRNVSVLPATIHLASCQ